MASETVVRLIDDTTGEDADETVRFGLDGTDYEVDLTKENADVLREALAPFVAGGRASRPHLSRRVRRGSYTSKPSRPAGSAHVQEIRRWGRAQGYEISDRGRVSREVMTAYEQANPGAAF